MIESIKNCIWREFVLFTLNAIYIKKNAIHHQYVWAKSLFKSWKVLDHLVMDCFIII